MELFEELFAVLPAMSRSNDTFQVERYTGRYKHEWDEVHITASVCCWCLQSTVGWFGRYGPFKPGSWETFRKAKIGRIQLAAGRQRMVFKPGGRFGGALMDLREVRLIPVEQ